MPYRGCVPARNENFDRYGSIGLSFVCEFFKTLLDSCGFAIIFVESHGSATLALVCGLPYI